MLPLITKFVIIMEEYPSLRFIKRKLKNNLTKPFRKKILAAYVIGSEANGTSKADSDIDVAVIIDKLKRKSSLKVTEEYHSNFIFDYQKPSWNNKIIDFQFFYIDEFINLNIAKIKLY